MKKIILSVLFVLVFFSVKAQEIKNNEIGSWYTLSNNFKFTERFYVANVTEIRLINFAEKTRIFLIDPSVNYKVTKSVTASLGYMYLNFHQEGIRVPSIDYENRIWQAVSVSSKVGKVKLTQRLMFEQRYFTKIDGSNAYQNRFRYRVNLGFNILKLKNEKYILGKVCEELRVRSASGISEPQFDQNNFGVFLGYPLLDNSKVYVGYQRDYYKGASGYWGDNLMHIILTYNFDFSKKK